jgi:hypothetical protein
MEKISCKLICRLKEAIANLKCPNCFGTKVSLCEEEKDENAECELCGCQFEFKPEFPGGGMD